MSVYAIDYNPIIEVTLTHSNLHMVVPEVKFSLMEPICEIKLSLVKRFGTDVDSMDLVLREDDGTHIVNMTGELQPLGSYGAKSGNIIHVIDTNPHSITAQLEDLSQVEKYVMSDENYDKLPVSMRKFLKNLKENNPELFTHTNIITDPDYQKDTADTYTLGDRCEIISHNEEERNRGEIRYIGRVPDMGEGFYVGVKLDEPYGMNDGSCKGVAYFECQNKYGIFIRPEKVQVGDFPEVDPFASDDDSDEDEI